MEYNGKMYINANDMPQEEIDKIFARMEISSRLQDHELVCKLKLAKIMTEDEDKKQYIQDQIDKFLLEQEKSYKYTSKK